MRIFPIAAVSFALAGVSLLEMPPAAAGVTPIQDQRIAPTPSGPYIGGFVYTETGTGQTVRKDAPPGKSVRFFEEVKNRGDGSNLHIEASGSLPCFEVRYWGGPGYGTNFTSIFTAGTNLPNDEGHTERVRIDVRVRTCAVPGQVKYFNLDTSPVPGPADFDRVRAKVVVVP